MLIEKDIQKVMSQLIEGESDPINLSVNGSDIYIRITDNSTKLFLKTLVYEGGNYIPSSVRHCLSHHSPFKQASVRTFLSVDEQRFQINLNYLGFIQFLTPNFLKEILEEFSQIAEQWRLHLDKHDKDDLVYVRTK